MNETTTNTENAADRKTCPRCGLNVDGESQFCDHCGAPVGAKRHVPWWHLHRKIYDWTLAWAYRPSSAVALFIISFTESIVFPVPPDVLLIPMVLGNRRRWLRTCLNCTAASVLGAMTAFLIGYLAWGAIDEWAFRWFAWAGLTAEHFRLATPYIEKGNFWIVFSAGFTPLPFKVFNIVAGSFFASPDLARPGLYCFLFFAAALISRAGRFFLVGGLMRAFGAKITPFVDKYFNWLALLFAALLIGGFAAIKYLR